MNRVMKISLNRIFGDLSRHLFRTNELSNIVNFYEIFV